jgi:hypothetical protein
MTYHHTTLTRCPYPAGLFGVTIRLETREGGAGKRAKG